MQGPKPSLALIKVKSCLVEWIEGCALCDVVTLAKTEDWDQNNCDECVKDSHAKEINVKVRHNWPERIHARRSRLTRLRTFITFNHPLFLATATR
jgi:hypothetical protein